MVQLRLPGYEGPLDLLLQLIERRALEISELSLVQVADQFMEQVARLQSHSAADRADSLAEFILIGAKLMQIKARALLPRDPDPDAPDVDADDAGRDLVEMLEEYRRFRDAVSVLQTIDRSGLRAFRPGAPPPLERPAPVGLPDAVTLDLLTKLVQEAYTRVGRRRQDAASVELRPDPITVADKIGELQERLRRDRKVSFRGWIAQARTRVEVIVTFMAILELYKGCQIEMRQDEVYGDILLVAHAGDAEPDGPAASTPSASALPTDGDATSVADAAPPPPGVNPGGAP